MTFLLTPIVASIQYECVERAQTIVVVDVQRGEITGFSTREEYCREVS